MSPLMRHRPPRQRSECACQSVLASRSGPEEPHNLVPQPDSLAQPVLSTTASLFWGSLTENAVDVGATSSPVGFSTGQTGDKPAHKKRVRLLFQIGAAGLLGGGGLGPNFKIQPQHDLTFVALTFGNHPYVQSSGVCIASKERVVAVVGILDAPVGVVARAVDLG